MDIMPWVFDLQYGGCTHYVTPLLGVFFEHCGQIIGYASWRLYCTAAPGQ
jgi:hypothetical protein